MKREGWRGVRRGICLVGIVWLVCAAAATSAWGAGQNPDGTYSETAGGDAATWTNYTNAGGIQGPTVPGGATIEIACVVQGFRVSDGNTAWYEIAQSPWSNSYFVSADAFYNNGQTSGSLVGTPFVDGSVPACGQGYTETAGGAAHTWTDYNSAGGTQGPTIGGGAMVKMTCKIQGFRVQDGNVWWYRIADPPWNGVYYVSADAFYNNGATSGSLVGTPFVDNGVPDCVTQPPPTGTNETAGGAANTWTDYNSAGGTQGPTIGGGSAIVIACKIQGFRVADGNTWWYRIGQNPWNGAYYVSADAFYNNGQTSGSLVGTPFYDPAVPDCTPPGSTNGAGGTSTTPGGGANETAGGDARTWTNPANAGGTQGPTVPGGATVLIACKLTGFQVQDGNTWWYQIASPDWNGQYYVSADAFYNNGQTSGSLRGTPFVDSSVPDCATAGGGGGGGAAGRPSGETAGGHADTFGNYSHAGVPGPPIEGGTTVSISCRAQGFRVADGNTWWYLVASAPWSDVDYVSADAFYNNGATSGSLAGTPFYDPAVPVCQNNREAPLYGTSYGSSSSSSNPTSCGAADPVNCASGNFSHNFTDVSVRGRGPGLTVVRTYNSLSPASSGLFGRGWTTPWDQQLNLGSADRATDGTIVATLDDGSQITATPTAGGGFATPDWSNSSLVANADGTFTLTLHKIDVERFSAAGQLLSIGDLNGSRTTLGYAASGRLSTVTDAGGRVLQVTFGSNGLVSSVKDPLGRSTSYGYDPSGNLTSVTDPLSRSWSYGYDANHRMLTMTDPRGGVVTNTYDDATGRVSKQVDAAGLATSFDYTGDNFGSVGGTTTITDPHGNKRLEQYASGFLTQVTKGVGTAAEATWTYAYDPATYGRTTIKDPNGAVTTHTYDAAGHVLTTTDALGKQTAYTYNGLGEELTVTSPLGEATSRTYDASGNPLTARDPRGNTTTNAYADSGHPGDVTSITDPDGRVAKMTYDRYGDLASRTVSPSAGIEDTTAFVYDADGEVLCEASPNATAAGTSCPASGTPYVSGTTRTGYDADGEVSSVTNPLGRTTYYSYDADGNTTRVTDPDGNVTASTYDADNRTISKSTGAGTTIQATTTSVYDIAAGSGGCPTATASTYCTSTRRPTGGVTIHAFDARDEEVRNIRPDGHTTRFAYDATGNRVATTDAAGIVTTAGYDADNRVTSVTYSDGSTPGVTYAYDADGHRTGMTDGTGSTTSAYDAAGRVTSVTNGAGARTDYGYDGNGDITSLGYPGGHTVTRAYDGAGRMSATADWLGHKTTFAYDRNGNVTTTAYPNTDKVTSTYDATDLLSRTSAGPSATVLASIAYTRDPAGQISGEVDSGAIGGSTAYVYDRRSQLYQAGGTALRYDGDGNLIVNGRVNQTFDVADGLVSGTDPTGATAYAYGASGDRTGSTPAWGRATRYGYDAAHRLVSVARPAPTPAVSRVSPASGTTAGGGTSVTIAGHGFTETTAVKFGGTAASFTVGSDSQLTAVSPYHAVGTSDITVTGPGGTSATVGADTFTYVATPGVSGIAPNAGPTVGGSTVTVTGGGFTGATKVSFGTVAAPSFHVASDKQLTVTVPAGSAGTADIVVTTAGGVSAKTAADRYLYVDGPAVTGVSPASGPTGGGTAATVNGSGFTGATGVLFGSVAATSFSVVSDNQVRAVAPAGSASVDVSVQTPAGATSPVAADRFGYVPAPTVTSVGPIYGSAAGGSTVTITGTDLGGATSVIIGGVRATYKVVSNTTILAVAPAKTGVWDVFVNTAGGTNARSQADHYTYVADGSSYTYNGDGLRMTSGTTGFTWDTSQSVPQLLSDGTTSYVYGPDGLPIEQLDPAGNTSYYFHDAVGSTRELLDRVGNVGATFTYSAYGSVLTSTGALRTPLLFAGGYLDQSSGLYYLVHRYYDPGTGQFLTPDPASDATGDIYGYVEGDPINAADPLGLFPWKKAFSIATSVAAIGCAVSGVCAAAVAVGLGVVGLGFAATTAWEDCSPPRNHCSGSIAVALISAYSFGTGAALAHFAGGIGSHFYDAITGVAGLITDVFYGDDPAPDPSGGGSRTRSKVRSTGGGAAAARSC